MYSLSQDYLVGHVPCSCFLFFFVVVLYNGNMAWKLWQRACIPFLWGSRVNSSITSWTECSKWGAARTLAQSVTESFQSKWHGIKSKQTTPIWELARSVQQTTVYNLNADETAHFTSHHGGLFATLAWAHGSCRCFPQVQITHTMLICLSSNILAIHV